MKKSCVKYKRKGSKLKKLFVALFIIASIIVGVSIFIRNNVNPMIVTLSKERIRSLTSDAVCQAVIDVMKDNADFDYLTVSRDEDQKIQSVEVDAKNVTYIAQKISLTAQKYINALGSDGIKIPIGSLSGITMFTGLGPDVNIKIYLVGSTHTQIISVFTSAGINQTIHRLYFNITGDVAVAVPGIPATLKASSQVLLGETIIVGEVPPTYLQSTTISDMLDLVA